MRTIQRAAALLSLVVGQLTVADLCGLPNDTAMIVTIRIVSTINARSDRTGRWETFGGNFVSYKDYPTEEAAWNDRFRHEDSFPALPESPYCRYPNVTHTGGTLDGITASWLYEIRIYPIRNGSDIGRPTSTKGFFAYFGDSLDIEATDHELLGNPSEWRDQALAGKCDLPEDEATVAVWRTLSGCWSGCGPVGCTERIKKGTRRCTSCRLRRIYR